MGGKAQSEISRASTRKSKFKGEEVLKMTTTAKRIYRSLFRKREREREKYYLANFDKVQQMITAGAVVNYVIIQATEIFYLEMEATFNYRNTKHTH